VFPTRVAVIGDPQLVEECAPSGANIEVVPVDAGDSPELILVFGSAVLGDLPAPAILLLDGDAERPSDLRPTDRLVASVPGVPGAWRVMPLPVADRAFQPVDAVSVTGCAQLLGADGPRRRAYLERFEHSVALVEAPAQATVAVNLHDTERAVFESRVAHALAAGRLLVSETLQPSFGLEPGIDYLEARDLTDLFVTVENAGTMPDAYATVRSRGRRKAEWFRSSRVVERLARDLRLETGTNRS
jgi:hypothetical protein